MNSMQLTILGNSGSFPRPGSACSGYLLESGGKYVLLDCGNGTLSRFQQFHTIQEIDAIFLSHLHFDHIGDLFLLRYAYETLKAFGQGNFLPIPVYLPETPIEIMNLLRDEELFTFHLINDESEYNIGEMEFSFHSMQHTVECHGISVRVGAKRLVYSADTTYHEALIDFAREADIFLCEATTSGGAASPVPLPHLTARQAGAIAARAQVKRLLLTHSSFMEEKQEILRCAQRSFPAAELGEELKTYTI